MNISESIYPLPSKIKPNIDVNLHNKEQSFQRGLQIIIFTK